MRDLGLYVASLSVGGLFGFMLGLTVASAGSSTEVACKETARLLSALESVERGESVFEFAHVHNDTCWIRISAPLNGHMKLYNSEGAQTRIDALLNKQGMSQ